MAINFLAAFVGSGYAFTADMIAANHMAVVGLLAMILSFVTFVSTLLLHAIATYISRAGR